ncbi:MAG: superoxide dismutase [Chitinophagaceae bacterium]
MNNYNNTRRKFIKNATGGVVAMSIGSGMLNAALAANNIARAAAGNTGFDQQPLPYKYDALENVIDAMTMEIHYSKHAAAYCKNLKDAAAVEGIDITKPVENVLVQVSKYSAKIRNNAGGHYNHELFWQCMRPKQIDNKPTGKMLEMIEKNFQSFDNFKKLFSEAGKTRFGSGWAWLYMDKDFQLKIGSSPNQDNPLMDIAEIKGYPLLALDVWEHAYYLKYQNKRVDYIDNWWNVVNWDFVATRALK